ncbi:MAG TPA: aminoglycoside 6'-N-acetyltransferase [Rhizomicrobium sp.]|jgi:aminoglycoside 6'-N-acetyltransferase I|nr:aminoglycoside 6'-N-acetyltransferase [Rhizomicrobium sp.]
MHIETCNQSDMPQWVALRIALWPDEDAEQMTREAPGMLAQPDMLVLVAREGETVIGFAEAAIRRDYVNGCETSPVAFVEGIYVVPQQRRRGVARAMIAAVETWARLQGLSELASDALLDNAQSHAMHNALGFGETERVVYFRKAL